MSEVEKSQPIMMIDDEEAWLDSEIKRRVWIGPFDKAVGVVDSIYNWGRRSSIWPMQFGLACCAIEMICAGGGRFDIARFGAELFRPSPRQADLMIVAGTVTKKMVPAIVRLYNQMAEPKYVMAMGACASAGGPFKEGYNVVSGIDKFLPVDVYVPGCPPTPQALLNGLITLQKKIDAQSVRAVPWYQAEQHEAVPEPVLGPDIYDQRRAQEIKVFSADPEKLESLYVHIASRQEVKHGKKEEGGEAKPTSAAKPAPAAKPAVAAKPTPTAKAAPMAKPVPEAGTPAPGQVSKTEKPAAGTEPGKEAPKETPIPKPAATEPTVTPPATRAEAGTGGAVVNPRTVDVAAPAEAKPDATAPIEATRGEVRPIPANAPDKLMSERRVNPPGERDPHKPALSGVPTATPEDEAKLAELKADADFAARMEGIHRELAEGTPEAQADALKKEMEGQSEVAAEMRARQSAEGVAEVEPGAAESKEATKKYQGETAHKQAAGKQTAPENPIVQPTALESKVATDIFRGETKMPDESLTEGPSTEDGNPEAQS